MNKLRTLFFSMIKNNKYSFFFILILAVLSPLFIVTIMSQTIGILFSANESMHDLVFNSCIKLVTIFFCIQFAHYIKGFLLSRVLSKIDFDCKKIFFNKLLSKDLNFFFKKNEGQLAEGLSSYAENLTEVISNLFLQMFSHLFEVLWTVVYIFTQNQILGYYFVLWTTIIYAIGYFSNKTLLNISEKLMHARSNRKGFLIDMLKNINIQKIFSFEKIDSEVHEMYSQKEKKLYSSVIKYQWWQVFSIGFLNIVFMLIGMYLSYELLILKLGVAAIGVYILMLNFAFRVSFGNWLILLALLPLLQKLGFCMNSQEIIEDEENKIIRNNIPCPKNPVIKFDNVSKTIGQDTFLKSANMTINPKHNILIEGKSGSGKTTLFLLLLGIMDNTKGSITINGTNIMDIDSSEWVDKFAYVPQTAILYNDTIRNNIVRGLESYHEEDFIKVCKICLIDEFANNMSKGYDAPVGVSGNNLSGGQRQRVVLARALMRDYNIVNGVKSNFKRTLCLDEAWASLSREEAVNIAKNLSKDLGHRGFIVIDHTEIWKDICGKKIDAVYSIENGIIKG